MQKDNTFIIKLDKDWYCNTELFKQVVETCSKPKRTKEGWEYEIKFKYPVIPYEENK